MMLCNPHNPGGTVYTREELEAQLAFAQRHDLVICSDEIHCDLLLEPGAKHIPIASLSDDAAQRSITLMAPSKPITLPDSARLLPLSRIKTSATVSTQNAQG